MKGEFDACLVIQVAGNDFTSSNLRLYTSSFYFFNLMWRFLLLYNKWNVGYIKSSL